MIDISWAPIAGALVGFIVGLTGIGGGALMAPILLTLFNIDLPTVVATDLLFATITKVCAGGMHVKNKFADWQVTKRLWMGSIPATIIVVIAIQAGLIFKNPYWIKLILGVLVTLSGISLAYKGIFKKVSQNRSPKMRSNIFQKNHKVLTISAGGVLGTLVTMTSVGAGALGAVFLRSLYPKMTPTTLVATDTIHAIPVSFIGGISLLFLGITNLKLLLLLLLGSLPAAILGSWIVGKMRLGIVQWMLAIILLIAGIKLVLS